MSLAPVIENHDSDPCTESVSSLSSALRSRLAETQIVFNHNLERDARRCGTLQAPPAWKYLRSCLGTDRFGLNPIRRGRDIGATQPEDDQDDEMAQSTSLGT